MKKTSIRIYISLAAVFLLLLFFFISSLAPRWTFVWSTRESYTPYAASVEFRYNGVFNPTIKSIKIISSDDEVLAEPLIDLNNNMIGLREEDYKEKLSKGQFDLIDPTDYKLSTRQRDIMFIIEYNEKFETARFGPIYLEIEFKPLFITKVEKFMIPVNVGP